MDALIEAANIHLRALRPRYQLQRVNNADMELEVIDRDLGDDLRAVSGLSGGETFLFSLALALGLSDLSSKTTQIESLFIDEGFGTLDPQSLEVVLSVLDQLQAQGRTIVVVSHVPEIAERIGFEVQIRPAGSGKSQVQIKTP